MSESFGIKPPDLMTIIATYEGAMQEANESPDDDDAVKKLEVARHDLMQILQIARAWEKASLERLEVQLPQPMYVCAQCGKDLTGAIKAVPDQYLQP
jgi:hypothetical protein